MSEQVSITRNLHNIMGSSNTTITLQFPCEMFESWTSLAVLPKNETNTHHNICYWVWVLSISIEYFHQVCFQYRTPLTTSRKISKERDLCRGATSLEVWLTKASITHLLSLLTSHPSLQFSPLGLLSLLFPPCIPWVFPWPHRNYIMIIKVLVSS